MAKKLYVGGLPYEVTEAELRELFEEAGTVVAASIISDRMTGRSRGFGFVEMATEDEARAAMSRFDGEEFQGRRLVVNEARPMEDRAPRDGDRAGGRDRNGGERRR